MWMVLSIRPSSAMALARLVWRSPTCKVLIMPVPGIPDDLLAHLSPLKWEHINLTGDYHWRRDAGLRNRRLRPLRSSDQALKLAA